MKVKKLMLAFLLKAENSILLKKFHILPTADKLKESKIKNVYNILFKNLLFHE